MRIIGCDLHARQETLAMLDTTTGEVVKKTLKHESNNVRVLFQSSTTGACGNRSHGIDAVVL
jgi:chromosome condensin MukBEF ATPase and DNA-binding subunit MukB